MVTSSKGTGHWQRWMGRGGWILAETECDYQKTLTYLNKLLYLVMDVRQLLMVAGTHFVLFLAQLRYMEATSKRTEERSIPHC